MSREATFLYNNLLLVALCLTILGGHIPDPDPGCGTRADHRERAVLQLLPAHLRDAAAAADGDRAARRLAARLAPLARAELRVAGRDRSRRRRGAARPRRRLVLDRPRRVHVLRLRARLDRLRVHPRDPGAPRARRGLLALRLRGARGAQPAPLRRLRRPRGDRPAGDRHRRLERLRQGARAEAEPRETMAVGHYRLTYRSLVRHNGPNAEELRAVLDVRKSGEVPVRRFSPGRTTIAPRTRTQTRSASGAICSPARTCS